MVDTGIGTGEDEQARPELSVSTGYLLSAAGRLIRDRVELALSEVGLRNKEFGALIVLATEQVAAQGVVGQRLQMDKSMMVSLMDQLEQQGFVERQRNPRDRRAYDLRLTDAGWAKLAEAQQVVSEVEDGMLAALDDTQRATLSKMLVQIMDTSRSDTA
jgi:DNA-binding MarR family transcriptional regulator